VNKSRATIFFVRKKVVPLRFHHSIFFMSNIYIKIKTTGIDATEWETVWQEMRRIITDFPLPLTRTVYRMDSAYNCHYDTAYLFQDIGLPTEHLAFSGDNMSMTGGEQFFIHRHWDTLKTLLHKREERADKPVYWQPADVGSYSIYANGTTLGKSVGIETDHAAYHFLIFAIGVLYENRFPDNVFIWSDTEMDDAKEVLAYLEMLFHERFELPISHDADLMLRKFKACYADETDGLIRRFSHLTQVAEWQKIAALYAHIDTEMLVDYYSKRLARYEFDTYPANNVLDAFILGTHDLELTLKLFTKTKTLLEASSEKYAEKRAKTYDLAVFLGLLLSKFILWTPQQRAGFERIYTNLPELETDEKRGIWDLFSNARSMRVEVCPISTTPQTLFEAFMYHRPKDGKLFKRIIDRWQAKSEANSAKMQDTIEKMGDMLTKNAAKEAETEEETASLAEAFLTNYPPKHHFFVARALRKNPAFLLFKTSVLPEFYAFLNTEKANTENTALLKKIATESKAEKITAIKVKLQQQGFKAMQPFFDAIAAENHENVLFHLRFILGLYITDRPKKYAKFRVLSDVAFWEVWRV
jgi:hypothetical protein